MATGAMPTVSSALSKANAADSGGPILCRTLSKPSKRPQSLALRPRFSQQPQQTVENGDGVGRTAGDVQIDR